MKLSSTHCPLELFPPLTLSLLTMGIFFVPTWLVLLSEITLLYLSTTCSRLMSLSKCYISTYISSLIWLLIFERWKSSVSFLPRRLRWILRHNVSLLKSVTFLQSSRFHSTVWLVWGSTYILMISLFRGPTFLGGF